MPARTVAKAFFPLDKQLGVADKHWSEGVARQAVWLSGMVAYGEAVEILEAIGQVSISESSVWRLTQKWGERLVAVEAQESQRANASPDGKEIPTRETRHAQRKGVSMDGTMIYIRGEERKELKVGCLFDVVKRPILDPQTGEWHEQGQAANSTYVAHLGGPEDFGHKIWTEAQKCQFSQAPESQVVADRAAWIWNLVKDYFYRSLQLVDCFHGTEHLARVAHLLYGEGTPGAKRWRKDRETLLFQGHADEIVRMIRDRVEHSPIQAEGLLSEAGYFENHQHRMNYMEMREEGWVIGRGMVESGGKQFKARFCGARMRWSRQGAERLLPIRTAILSKTFPQRWKATYNSPLN